MIVKIQRPLESSIDQAPAFVYNEDRSFKSFVAFTDGLKMAMGEREKIYVEATVGKDGELRLIREVGLLPW